MYAAQIPRSCSIYTRGCTESLRKCFEIFHAAACTETTLLAPRFHKTRQNQDMRVACCYQTLPTCNTIHALRAHYLLAFHALLEVSALCVASAIPAVFRTGGFFLVFPVDDNDLYTPESSLRYVTPRKLPQQDDIWFERSPKEACFKLGRFIFHCQVSVSRHRIDEDRLLHDCPNRRALPHVE